MKHQSVGKRIGALSRAAHTFFQYHFRDFSIGHAQVITLNLIIRNNGIGQNELVQHSGMDKSSVTSQLKILEKNGYIIRKIDENDGRGRKIFITKKTEPLEPELLKKFTLWSELLLRGFSNPQREQIFQFLDIMINNANQALKGLKEVEENK
ncbi:MAG: MarR family transcriptional regulator [Bacteroidales bacterium]|nr:MarR family transcriptional regulator [Bacteroidales bacterium]